ncbi:hypothetical protein B9Z44_02440 [Limnohabitans curvus]|uniref:DUF2933 domain-containing protein n=1 Tax=Limnohabitans curvus TaxID=323423 RepID=A0A315EP72_9BURK|nr:DUF2933 domain-containing protein [Limnohabitans curvus]PUE58555.1 hypothetical protein B9Z44_02440 [Limnohabitans curvus]
MTHQHEGQDSPPSYWSSRYAIGLLVIGGVAAYFLLTEHLAHVVGALPFLLLLACPLMHVFMHGGHGHHHGHNNSDAQNNSDSKKSGEPS